ncbi:MAG: maleate cis-trans isomerase [Dehalococcoidia bacterium]
MAEEQWKRIGVLLPPMNVSMEPDMYTWAPDGVTVHITRMFRSEAVTGVTQLQEMLEGLEEDTRRLAFTRPHIIVYGCTSGSSLEPKQDQDIARRIEAISGTPAIATAGAVVEALRALDIHRVAVATPYVDEINERELAFLRDYGFDPVSLEALRFSASYDIADVSQEQIYQLAISADRPEAQGLFISCTNLRTAPIIDRLEQELGKPVVTSNQASMWLALRRMGVMAPVSGGGRLMAKAAEVAA